MAATDLIALPVSLDLPRPLHDDVQRHLEGAIGWQVTTSNDLPARLHLFGVGRPTAPVPSILVVGDGDEPAAAAVSALGAAGVLRWPADAPDLLSIASGMLALAPTATVPTLRIRGASGGLGTSTLALALGGLVAWRGHDVLVASSSDLAVPAVPTVTTLRGSRPWEAAAEVPGIPRLRAIQGPPGRPVDVAGPDLVIEDVLTGSPHLLVAATDRVGLAAVRASEVGAVVVVDRGPVDVAELAAAAGPRLAAVLSWSHRVGHAGLRQRVPASLPGSYLAQLSGVAARVARDIAERTDRTPTS